MADLGPCSTCGAPGSGIRLNNRPYCDRCTDRHLAAATGWPTLPAPAKLRLAAASMGEPDTRVSALCAELGITRQTLYRHVSPTRELRPDGHRLLNTARARPRRPSKAPACGEEQVDRCPVFAALLC
jgi:hypothetical protein